MTIAAPKVTEAEIARAREVMAANPGIGREKLAKEIGCTFQRARTLIGHVRGIKRGDPKPTPETAAESFTSDGDTATVTKIVNKTVRTLTELIAACEIDESEWEVERWTCGKWDGWMKPPATTVWVDTKDGRKVPQWVRSNAEPIVQNLFKVQAWLKRKRELISIAAQVEELQRKAEAHAPQYPALIFRDRKASGNLVELSIYDHHFAAFIWGEETGHEDYGTPEADRVFRDALVTLLERSRGFGIDSIMLSLGNDLQNADNRAGTTEAGTPQSNDTRYQKVCGVVQDTAVWAIETCMEQAHGDVIVPMIYGNHDPLTTFHLGGYLKAWFRNCPRVKIDNSPLQRKVYQHGTVMLMLTHGKGIKTDEYPLLMATEHPRMWADTTIREVHTGHIHTRRNLQPTLEEVKGIAMRSMPSMRPPCAWSSSLGYVGNLRNAEAMVWNEREGLIGTANYTVRS